VKERVERDKYRSLGEVKELAESKLMNPFRPRYLSQICSHVIVELDTHIRPPENQVKFVSVKGTSSKIYTPKIY